MKLAISFICIAVSCAKAPVSSTSNVRFEQLPWEPGQVVSVCWQSASSATIAFRTTTETAVNRILRDVNLDFRGWDDCTREHSEIRIFIYDDDQPSDPEFQEIKTKLARISDSPGHPRVTWISDWLNDEPLPSNMFIVLNTSFEDSYPEAMEIYEALTSEGKKNLIESTTIHEFGHALGLRHEDAHPDSRCAEFDESLDGDVVISDYNPFSFMSRCFYRLFNYNLGMIYPNDQDLAAIKSMYD